TDRLGSLSPLAILARGYSITSKLLTGEIIRGVDSVEIDDDLKIRVHHGQIIARAVSVGKKVIGNQ
ncbi:MAG: hypothetical protein QME42_02660, partial [bacterium]|nr:hypothetical protein [bacterium]